MTTTPDETPIIEQFVPLEDTEAYSDLKTNDLSRAHLAAARNFHETVGAIGAQGEEFVANATANARLNPPLTETMQDPRAQIDVLVARGHLPGREAMAARHMIEFLGELGNRQYTKISEMKQAFSEWRADARINQEETPLVYHVSHILELAATTNQSTLPVSVNELSSLAKSDDGSLCTIRHRNWLSERLGLCGAANNSIAGDVIRIAAISATAAGAATGLTALAALTGPGAVMIGAIVSALTGAGLAALWSDAWCKTHCDDCGAANGVSALFDGCTFTGIVATGNAFAFNEGVTFRIDENNDGQTDFTVESNSGSVISRSTRLPDDRPFRVQADVTCDGGSEIDWGDLANWIPIDPVRNSPTLNPTVNLTSPPMAGMSYPTGQLLTFTANINTNGWDYLGWSAPGGSPSSGSGRTFFVEYDFFGIDQREITFRFRNPCTGATLNLLGDEFLICNEAATGGYCP